MNPPASSLPASPLRVLLIGSTYPLSHDDHQVPWLRESVRRIVARGHHVEVLASSYRGRAEPEIDGVRVHRFRYAPARLETLTHGSGAPNKVHSFGMKLLAVPYIVCGCIAATWRLWTGRFDLVHVHWPFPHGLMALLAARLAGIPVVSTCHGAELALGRKSPRIARVLAWCLEKSAALTCNSRHTRSEIARITTAPVAVIPYGSTVGDLPPPCRNPRIPGPDRLLFCGRLIQRKGIHYLIQAMAELTRNRSIVLDITGEGKCRAEWEALVDRLGLRQQVRFHGFVSTERLAQLYREADVYVHPAIYDDNGDTEGLGVVLVEALVNELPVVACEVGGITDVIEHGSTGLLVPEKSPAGLVNAIEELLDNPARARLLARRGRVFALEYFDWDRIAAETEAVYRSALRRDRASAAAPRPLTA